MAVSGQTITVIDTDGSQKEITLYTSISDVTENYKEFIYNEQTLYASTTTDPTNSKATVLKFAEEDGTIRYLCTETP